MEKANTFVTPHAIEILKQKAGFNIPLKFRRCLNRHKYMAQNTSKQKQYYFSHLITPDLLNVSRLWKEWNCAAYNTTKTWLLYCVNNQIRSLNNNCRHSCSSECLGTGTIASFVRPLSPLIRQPWTPGSTICGNTIHWVVAYYVTSFDLLIMFTRQHSPNRGKIHLSSY